MGFRVFLVHPTVVSVLLSASVERGFVSRMRDFLSWVSFLSTFFNTFLQLLVTQNLYECTAPSYLGCTTPGGAATQTDTNPCVRTAKWKSTWLYVSTRTINYLFCWYSLIGFFLIGLQSWVSFLKNITNLMSHIDTIDPANWKIREQQKYHILGEFM